MASGARQADIGIILIVIGIVVIGCVVGFVMTKVQPVLMLMATLAIVVLIAGFIWPPIALYILTLSMLLSPEFGQRGTQGEGFTIRLDDLLLVLVTFSWFVKSAVIKDLGLFPTTPINKGILAYLLICIFSTIMGGLFGKVNIIGFVFVVKYFEYFIVFFMAVNFIHTEKQAKTFVAILLITFGIVCVYSFMQIPAGVRISAPFEGKEGEPGTLGGYLLLMMSVSIGIYLTSESRKIKMLLLGAIAVSLLCIVATGSRGTWMGLPAVVVCFIVMSKKRLLIMGVLAVLIVTSPFVIPSGMKERYAGTFEKEKGAAQTRIGGKTLALDSSSSERINSWLEIINDLKNHPFFGYGVTGYGFIDSQYFRTLIEIGLLGFSIFMFFMYRIYRFLLEAYHTLSDSFEKGVVMGLIAGFTALLVHAITSNTFIVVRIMEPFWFLMGIAVFWYQTEKNKLSQSESLNAQSTATVAK